MNQTPEPVIVGLSYDKGYPVFRFSEFENDTEAHFSATAKRIEDCYNACAGMKDPEKTISLMVKALKVAVDEMCRQTFAQTEGNDLDYAIDKARKALAKAKEKS